MYRDDIPYGLHISKGANGVYYILNDSDIYLGKLSTNLDKAKKKAKEKVGRDVPVKIWLRFVQSSRSYLEFDPLKEKLIQHDAHIFTHQSYLKKIEFEKHKKTIQDKYSKFSHVGNVGDKLDLELTITKIFTYPIYTEFSDRAICGYCHKFTDKNNNKLIYFGASKAFVEKYKTENDSIRDREIYKVGDKITVKATIKQHTTDIKDVDSETEIGMPLTVIARPKIKDKK